ncbi:acetoin dehydrogenase dihydrolipoyllysine-residue acetyltransferase subunit [Mesorhizobium sp. LHD-90]|uniref:acetoin dehydrogenase dihydrolipoyllysine-residue acetyltransferase subunit n=1 Tax=Mesorhizobium sp. LHD-90 TaxID=3071414 RepID=UPI0027DFC814|nr:acetoin dehydrogenase dihydrolipoyllysine-residue acetyltransferase subunit [Mesorhizobium sp. LHD-90]MDQ6434126.1 acetoin dehydrogenase dihydrolipoyllysine-residue acetyltransferase subunit [Mesorhizobium sp. LHD-90]
MPIAVIFPKVSLETDLGTIGRWLKDDGAPVKQGEPLFEIDNDKAAVEVEATASGIVVHRREAGHEVQVGEVVGQILQPGEAPVDNARPLEAKAVPSRPAAAARVVAAVGPAESPTRVIATPLARRIAAQREIDLSSIRGSGPRGRIQKRDLLDLPLQALKAPAARTGTAHLHAVWLQREGTRTVTALHGFASDHNAWRSLLAAGRPRGRLLGLDLPGHGRSPLVVPGDLDAICEMVEAQLALEGVDSTTVVAHSFGAAVAARLAVRGFVPVRSLLLLAPAGLGPEIRSEFLKGFVAARQASSLLPWLHELVCDPSVVSQAFVRAVEEQRGNEELSRTLNQFAGHYFCDGTQTFSIRSDLERLRIPVRVVFGTEDRIIPFAHARALPGHVGLHALQRCGHLPYVEQPELTLSILNEMLALGYAER